MNNQSWKTAIEFLGVISIVAPPVFVGMQMTLGVGMNHFENAHFLYQQGFLEQGQVMHGGAS
ncbi:MAG: hypothetical protein O3C15_05265 [Proteobacteria bacterium]|nr:hypothetical protein [Pseudomonadota bacterium]